MNLVAEYDAYYRESPRKWESASHDEYVYKTVAPYGPAVNLLDVGCGNGHTLKHFSGKWPQARCFGIDLSPVVIDLARKRFPTITFLCAEWETSTLNSFDMALCVGVAEHFPDPLVGLKRLYSALDDGGVAYLEVPNCIDYPTSDGKEGYKRISRAAVKSNGTYTVSLGMP